MINLLYLFQADEKYVGRICFKEHGSNMHERKFLHEATFLHESKKLNKQEKKIKKRRKKYRPRVNHSLEIFVIFLL